VTTAVREAPHHRNLTCYTDYRCRRPECVERRNAWQRDLRRKQREGQPALIDAKPVREHIQTLQAAGTSVYRIALMAGVNDWTVRAFLPSSSGRRARKHSTTPEIARKILAVTTEAASSGYMDGTGTRRRIQALVAAGWPLRSMAEHLDLHPTYVGDLLRRGDRPVFTATAEKIARAYDQLKKQRPARRGVDPRAIKRARERAAENRWPTPKYWDEHRDDIDDPHFQPLYGVTRREIVAQDANELMRFSGLDRATAAHRLGVSKAYIDHAFRDHPQYAIGVAA
jgi:hypothetical protein